MPPRLRSHLAKLPRLRAATASPLVRHSPRQDSTQRRHYPASTPLLSPHRHPHHQHALSASALASALSLDSSLTPTIYALSTPPTTPPHSVIPSSPPKPRYALLRPLYHPHTHLLLDPGALCLFFAAPNSHTGESILELHLHGGPAIIRAVLSAIPLCTPNTRYAEPGEFTRRAFYNDRLSLPEIEALGEVIDASTEEQRKRAVRGSGPRLAERYEAWRRALVEARGELEALIDFSEDQHFEESNKELVAGVARRVEMLRETMKGFAENAVRGELLKSGISLSLVGAPNAGKSSLLNRVVGREAAIVSEEAGTTRDVVDLAVDVGGFMVVLGDTAGLRVNDVGNKVGRIEEEGIRRAHKRAMSADVVVAVVEIQGQGERVGLRISQELVILVNEAEQAGKEVVVVVNKIDLHPSTSPGLPMDLIRQLSFAFPSVTEDRIFGVSCVADSCHDGIQNLLHGLTRIFQSMTSPLGAGSTEEMYESIGATERQRLLVEACISFLDDFLEMVGEGDKDDVDVVAMAEELRGAADCLGRITGRGESGDVEEVLGVVFERFCVGK
ncbi:P-loop containing nucleoside triphosphate hydrolase protein [Wilcoxina mikolae CBS 423.85]|nr:P-loop containing nucleoside triphosphate hydrolase protein [Wilcoxina mikolae CBS 423.85]